MATAKKTVAKRTAKKSAAKPGSNVKVQMIQTVDSRLGASQTRVFFTDGTNALTKSGVTVSTEPEFVAPNMVKVVYERGQIASVETVETA